MRHQPQVAYGTNRLRTRMDQDHPFKPERHAKRSLQALCQRFVAIVGKPVGPCQGVIGWFFGVNCGKYRRAVDRCMCPTSLGGRGADDRLRAAPPDNRAVSVLTTYVGLRPKGRHPIRRCCAGSDRFIVRPSVSL